MRQDSGQGYQGWGALMARPSSRENLAVKVRESIGERIAPLMRTRCHGRIDMDVMREEELLEDFTSSDQKVAIAALTSKLERTFQRAFASLTRARGCSLDIRHDDDLEIPLDLVDESEEFGRCTNTAELWVGRHGHVRLERHMILV